MLCPALGHPGLGKSIALGMYADDLRALIESSRSSATTIADDYLIEGAFRSSTLWTGLRVRFSTQPSWRAGRAALDAFASFWTDPMSLRWLCTLSRPGL